MITFADARRLLGFADPRARQRLQAARADLIDFVEELGLTLDALTDASVGTSVHSHRGAGRRMGIMIWARFPDETFERKSTMTVELARNRIILEESRFSYDDLEELFEDLTQRVVSGLFAERGDSFGGSFDVIAASGVGA